MGIYFDNAATTPIDERVFDVMSPYLLENFGNPSSAHKWGRHAKATIENARQTIADILHAKPSEIYFTSSATEANNTAIRSALNTLDIIHAITSKLEHPAVLNTLRHCEANGYIKLSFVDHDHQGNIDLRHLEHLLASHNRTLVSIMHGNNEIGNLNDIDLIGDLCKKYSAIFHCDTVQTMSHYPFDLQKSNMQFVVASAHKFHGPKGVGFLYAKENLKIMPLLFGGGQERNIRAGTENVPGIVGLAKALEIAHQNHVPHKTHITQLKEHMIKVLRERIPEIQFNGNSADPDASLYTILSVSVVPPRSSENVLALLDDKNIAVSGGSACSSNKASHVLSAIGVAADRSAIRFSFSRFNTIQQADIVIEVLAGILKDRVNRGAIIQDYAGSDF